MKPALLLSLSSVLIASCSLVSSEGELRELWQTDDAVPDLSFSDTGAIDEERVYVLRDRDVAALDRQSGAILWKQNIRQDCLKITLAAGRILCASNVLYAFDAETGSPLWTYADEADSTFSQARGTADATRAFAATMGAVSAVDAATGQPLWRRSLTGVAPFGTWIRSLTLAPEGDLLVAVEAFYNASRYFSAAVIVALDPATGAERWRYQDGSAGTDRMAAGLTLWEDVMLYTDATGGEVVAVSRTAREVVWRRAWERGFLGSLRPPLVADGVAYWGGGDSRLYAADARTGALRWSVLPARGSYVSHEVCGPLLVGSTSFEMRVVRRSDGSTVGTLFGDEQIGQTAVADGVLYVSTARGVSAFACQ